MQSSIFAVHPSGQRAVVINGVADGHGKPQQQSVTSSVRANIERRHAVVLHIWRVVAACIQKAYTACSNRSVKRSLWCSFNEAVAE